MIIKSYYVYVNMTYYTVFPHKEQGITIYHMDKECAKRSMNKMVKNSLLIREGNPTRSMTPCPLCTKEGKK